jgi:hypothetical protein
LNEISEENKESNTIKLEWGKILGATPISRDQDEFTISYKGKDANATTIAYYSKKRSYLLSDINYMMQTSKGPISEVFQEAVFYSVTPSD